MSTIWEVTYSMDGQTNKVTMEGGAAKPTKNDAAIVVRNKEFSQVVLVDRTRGQSDNTLVWLEMQGCEIVSIEPIDSL